MVFLFLLLKILNELTLLLRSYRGQRESYGSVRENSTFLRASRLCFEIKPRCDKIRGEERKFILLVKIKTF